MSLKLIQKKIPSFESELNFHTHIDTYSQFGIKVNVMSVSLYCRKKSWYLSSTPTGAGRTSTFTAMGDSRAVDSNPGPSGCDATLLINILMCWTYDVLVIVPGCYLIPILGTHQLTSIWGLGWEINIIKCENVTSSDKIITSDFHFMNGIY